MSIYVFLVQMCIPCNGGVPCWAMDLASCAQADAPLVAAGGHLPFALTAAGLRARWQPSVPQEVDLPCVTFIRDPVDRIVSTYYSYWHVREEAEQGLATPPPLHK